MRKERENRGRGVTSISPGAVSSRLSMRPPRSRLLPELEQLPEARDRKGRSPRPRIQDRARARALKERDREMSGFVGIDVSKADFVVAREGVAGSKIYPNSERGCRDLLKDLEGSPLEIVVLEATGGYQPGPNRG